MDRGAGSFNPNQVFLTATGLPQGCPLLALSHILKLWIQEA